MVFMPPALKNYKYNIWQRPVLIKNKQAIKILKFVHKKQILTLVTFLRKLDEEQWTMM